MTWPHGGARGVWEVYVPTTEEAGLPPWRWAPRDAWDEEATFTRVLPRSEDELHTWK